MNDLLLVIYPGDYLPPFGVPLYWRNETSGLPAAVEKFHAHTLGQADALNQAQLALVIRYCQYFINAPCWADFDDILSEAREKAKTLETEEDIRRWIKLCMGAGLDPF